MTVQITEHIFLYSVVQISPSYRKLATNRMLAYCELPNDIRQHTGGLGPPCVALQTLLAAINKSSRVEVMRQYSAEHGSAEQFDSCVLWSSFYDLR